ncbi:DUF937 domain-containing protein [Flavobacterium supellecticarium]|uniref:DUF937 domain-containing protein n=1 Tax=Flavobacterium supellecticarium TaxID=2565924 RepID=A0A4S3ZZQ3_9FLAO|nr:DUF937 domain-containing protein [Flavobacterium supellecticarium]THF51494.1 DUF937 domain-containing protein [Flavobacterium supellecticarium]
MLEQLTQLVQQYGGDAIVKNEAIPNELNQDVMQQAGSSIFTGLQKIASEGNMDQLAGLFQGNNATSGSNPVVQQLSEQLTGDLGQKFGLSTEAASGVAGSLIPNVLGSLINKAKDPNQKGFDIADIVSAISGGNGNSGLMDAISKYGGQFGLDQNNDGKVDMSDAMAAVTKKGGIGGIFGKLFGR